mgnify:CR=1 FL=1
MSDAQVIRFPQKVPYLKMDKLELLEVFVGWKDEPGIDDIYTLDWVQRGMDLLPVLYDSAGTLELKKIAKYYYKLCKAELNRNTT